MTDIGFYGETSVNLQTGEVIIADRGTANALNLITDAQVATGAALNGRPVAEDYARAALDAAQSELANAGVSLSAIYTTGHSLGGAESQIQAMMLSTAADEAGNPLVPNDVHITNISLDAPGIGSLATMGNSSRYSSYNLSAQGDLVHLAGGNDLSGTTAVSLGVGPSMWATGGLLGLGTAAASLIPGGGQIGATAMIATALSNTLDAHSSAMLLNAMVGTDLGNAQISQLGSLSATQMQNMLGTATQPQYDVGGYDQNGYNRGGYNIYGVDRNGNLDPSITQNGGQTNTDILADGSRITVVIAGNGAATATLSASDGTTYTYNRNGLGQLTEISTQSPDGTAAKMTLGEGGAVSTITRNPDGSYNTYSADGQGNVTSVDHAVDGSSNGSTLNADGTSSQSQDDGHGDRTTTNRDTNGDVTSTVHAVTTVDVQGVASTTTTTTTYDSTTGTETGRSTSTDDGHGTTTTSNYDANNNLTSYGWQTEDGGSGTNTYGQNGTLTSETWQDGNGNSGTNTYGANGALTSSSWQAADGRSGTNAYDENGNLVSDAWQSSGGTSGTDTYREDGSRASDTWQSSAGSYGSHVYDPDGSSYSTTVTPGSDGATTTTVVSIHAPEDGYGGDYGGDYGPAYGQHNGYQVTQTTTTNADGSSADTITTNENGYNDTTATIRSADGSYTRNESDGLGNHSSYSYNAQTGEYDSSTYNADGSHTDTSGASGGDYNSTSYDANGNVTRTEVGTATSDTVTTHNSDGSTTVDVRAPSSNGGSWDETVTTTNPDGSHSETRITNDRHDRVTDNYDADGRIGSESGHYDSIPSTDWVGGVISSDWETTYNADGSSTRVEKESGGGDMITHVTETDPYDHAVSTSTIIDRYDHTRDETTQNADGSHSTAHWDSDGDYASHEYNSDGIDVHDASRSADGSTYDRTYDTDAGVATETSYDASTGGHTRYDHYYDDNGVEYKETGTVTNDDGNTVSMESLNTPEGWLTITTGPDGTEYSFGEEGGGDPITADQYDQYWTDYFGSDAASNDPGAGDSGTGDPAAGDGSTSTTDMAVGTPEQQAA